MGYFINAIVFVTPAKAYLHKYYICNAKEVY